MQLAFGYLNETNPKFGERLTIFQSIVDIAVDSASVVLYIFIPVTALIKCPKDSFKTSCRLISLIPV